MYRKFCYISIILLLGTLFTLAFCDELNNAFIIYIFVSSGITIFLGFITFLKPELYIKSFYYESKFKYKTLLVRFFGITCFIMGIFIFYPIFIDKLNI